MAVQKRDDVVLAAGVADETAVDVAAVAAAHDGIGGGDGGAGVIMEEIVAARKDYLDGKCYQLRHFRAGTCEVV